MTSATDTEIGRMRIFASISIEDRSFLRCRRSRRRIAVYAVVRRRKLEGDPSGRARVQWLPNPVSSLRRATLASMSFSADDVSDLILETVLICMPQGLSRRRICHGVGGRRKVDCGNRQTEISLARITLLPASTPVDTEGISKIREFGELSLVL